MALTSAMRRLAICVVLGCGGGGGTGASESEETGEPTPSTTATTTAGTATEADADTDADTDADADSDTDADTDTDADADTDADTDAVPVCGDGIIDATEECDGDLGCRSDCVLACAFLGATEVHGDVDEYLYLEDVQPGPDGTAIAVGTRGWGMGTDVVTAFVDADGELLDLEMYDHDGTQDVGVALTVAEDGSRFVVADAVNGPHVLHYDADGELDWVDTPVEASSGNGIAMMPGGGVVVSGTANTGTIGHFMIWAARYDTSGHVWSATWENAAPDVPWHPHAGRVAASPLGEVFIAGDQPSVSGVFGVYDPIVVAFGPEGGEAEWAWSEWLESSNLTLLARDVEVDPQGRVAALFYVAHGSTPSIHFLLHTFDPDGTLVRTIDSSAFDYGGGEEAGALAVDGDGRVIVFGRHIGSAAGDVDGNTFALAFDGEGEMLCEGRTDAVLGWTTGASMDHDGNMLVAGTQFVSTTESYGIVGRFRGFE